ncbi:YkvI family membrane protein [Paenibacillus cymbidii]|uniref:YkvI family membrane protein n=1 Tax=Paenibacillus cymbidii TaxID=1639034 RepID=UPI001080A0D6|nr:hypothetical protein [Paenibacillus cymbidii]
MKKTGQTIQVAFTYMGTIVGAGFASGQEILQFFTKYGWLAAITIAIASVLFIWLGTKLMVMAGESRTSSYEDFNKLLLGNRLGEWISLFMLVVLFGISTVMLAGAGTLFAEQLHMSYQAGLLVTMLLAYAVIAGGIRAIVAVNVVVVPLMLALTVVIVLTTAQLPGADNWLRLTSDHPLASVWLSPLLYVAFNLATAQAVLVPLGATIRDKSVLYRGGLLGGLGIGIMLLAGHVAMAAYMPGIAQFEIPMSHIVGRLGIVMQLVYAIIIFGEIFTTYVADVYGLTLQLEQRTGIGKYAIIALTLGAGYVVSQFGFGNLLSLLYPLFGAVSLLWFGLMLLRRRSA